ASHSVAARIDDARPALIVSADAGARGGKILPYKKLLDDAIAQDDARPALIVSADAGARGGKILPYKKLLDDAIAQAQHQPKHVLL
ncbi:hypothetical protein MJL30_35775, partial [Salmonella enterica subsp. enterica serovar Anatum]|nr:hypothetical protein [Salmonella enterica subsp. enterica serovar Anatum]